MKLLHAVGLLLIATNFAYADTTATTSTKPVIIDSGGSLKVVTPDQAVNLPTNQKPSVVPLPSSPNQNAIQQSTLPPPHTQPATAPSTPVQMPSMQNITPGTTPGGQIEGTPGS